MAKSQPSGTSLSFAVLLRAAGTEIWFQRAQFEKFMTKKLQTNDVGPIHVAASDLPSVPSVAAFGLQFFPKRRAVR